MHIDGLLKDNHKYDRRDEIEVETWFDVAGKNGTRRDWIVRDHYTKEIIAKATRCNDLSFSV